MAGGLKFRIKEVEGLYFPCSENKGAIQLRGYREADLRLCFRICKNRFSHNEAQLFKCQIKNVGSSLNLLSANVIFSKVPNVQRYVACC